VNGLSANSAVDWVAKAESLRLDVRNFVNGHGCDGDGGRSVQKFGPRDGALLYQLASGTAGDVDAAVAVARRAFSDGRWSQLTAQRRSEVLFRLAELVLQHREEFALLESLDTGKPIRDAFSFDVPRAAAAFRFCAAAGDKLSSKVYGVELTSLSYQSRRPMGVVAGIIGWNFPLVLAAEKIAPPAQTTVAELATLS